MRKNFNDILIDKAKIVNSKAVKLMQKNEITNEAKNEKEKQDCKKFIKKNNEERYEIFFKIYSKYNIIDSMIYFF